MALLDSKQLNPKLTGSFILSGSTQTFIGRSDFQGSITASGDISASGTVYALTGSFGKTETDVTVITENSYPASVFSGSIFISGSTPPIGTLNYASALTVLGDISASGNIDAGKIKMYGIK